MNEYSARLLIDQKHIKPFRRDQNVSQRLVGVLKWIYNGYSNWDFQRKVTPAAEIGRGWCSVGDSHRQSPTVFKQHFNLKPLFILFCRNIPKNHLILRIS